MPFVNTRFAGLNGYAVVDVEPKVVDTDHGAIRAFLTETGSVVVENAVGQESLHADGYGFVLACEYGYTRNSGVAVGPSHRTYAPEASRHNGERIAMDRIMRTMDGIARDFIRENAQAVVQRTHDHLSTAMSGWETIRRPSVSKPERSAVTDTPYGTVMLTLSDNGLVKLTGLGFQGSVEADGKTYVLAGHLDYRYQDQRNITVEELFAERQGRSYHWMGIVPEIADVAKRLFEDPGFIGAIKAREAYDTATANAIRSEEGYLRLNEEFQRVKQALEALATPEDEAAPVTP